MALTEWKLARSESEVLRKFQEGKKQACLYSAGVLGGVELTDTRYIVVVSQDMASGNDDVDEKAITYKYVNIAVHPTVPSAAARS